MSLEHEKVDRRAAAELARGIRREALRMTHRAGTAHIGSALSMADLLAVLYSGILAVDPTRPEDPLRDRFVLSKGHACSALYAALALRGFFPQPWLSRFCSDGSPLAGHASHRGVPGVEVSTGSLGHGLSLACGMALAGRGGSECAAGDCGSRENGAVGNDKVANEAAESSAFESRVHENGAVTGGVAGNSRTGSGTAAQGSGEAGGDFACGTVNSEDAASLHGAGPSLGPARYRVFTLLSDGECDEGSTWEAALFAAHHALDNLVAVVDYNRMQSLGAVGEVLALEPFADKWRAFGWEVVEVDGHDLDAIAGRLETLPWASGKPSCLLAHTVKGRGVSFMEGRIEWHYRSPDAREVVEALSQIDSCANDCSSARKKLARTECGSSGSRPLPPEAATP